MLYQWYCSCCITWAMWHPGMEEGCSLRCSAREEFLCPICLEVISDAAWLVDTRQLADRHCIIRWFEAGVTS